METVTEYIFGFTLITSILIRITFPIYLFFKVDNKAKYIWSVILLFFYMMFSNSSGEMILYGFPMVRIYFGWLFLLLILMFNDYLKIFSFSKKNILASIYWGTVIGAGFAVIFTLILQPETNYILTPDRLIFVLSKVIALGFAHEIFHKGFTQDNLVKSGTKPQTAIIFQGIVYALYFINDFPYSMLLHAGFGIALGFLYDKQKSITGPIVANVLAHLIIEVYSYTV